MNQRTTLVLSVLVALAGIGVFLAQSSSKSAAPAAAGPVPLFEPKPADVTRLELAAAGKPGLVFAKTNDKWSLVEPTAAAVDASRVDAEVTRLTGLQSVRAYAADDKARPGDDLTKLSAPAYVAKLTTKDGKSHALKIGAGVLMARNTYLQLEGDARLHVVQGDLTAEMHGDVEWFRDLRLADFALGDAVRISIGATDPIVLTKSADAKWTIESPIRARADVPAVNEVLSALSQARATKFVAEKPENLVRYGLDKPRLSVSVDVEKKTPRTPPPGSQPASQPEFDIEKTSYVIATGAKYETNVYARMGPQGAVFTLPEYTVQRLSADLEKLRDKKLVTADTLKATRLKVAGPAGAVELEKKDGLWRIVQPPMGDQDRAEFAAVDDALKALRDLKATAFEDATAGLTPNYGFEQGLSVELLAEGEVEPARITVGGATKGGTGIYVRNDRDNTIAVVKADALAAINASPMAYLDRAMLNFNKDHVELVTLNYEGQERALRKTGSDWKLAAPVEAPADAKIAEDMMTNLGALHARRIVGTKDELAQFGLDQPLVRAAIRVQPPAPPVASTQPAASQAASEPTPPTPPAVTHTVLAARKDGKAYLFVEGGTRIAEVDDKIVADLLAEPHDHKVTVIDTSKLVSIELAYPDRTLLLEKKGNDWTLEGEPGFKGDEVKVRPIAEALRDLQTDRYVSYNATDLAAYKLAPAEMRITVKTETESRQLLIAAEGPPADAAGRRYATIAGTNKVFLINPVEAQKFQKQIKDIQQGG